MVTWHQLLARAVGCDIATALGVRDVSLLAVLVALGLVGIRGRCELQDARHVDELSNEGVGVLEVVDMVILELEE